MWGQSKVSINTSAGSDHRSQQNVTSFIFHIPKTLCCRLNAAHNRVSGSTLVAQAIVGAATFILGHLVNLSCFDSSVSCLDVTIAC